MEKVTARVGSTSRSGRTMTKSFASAADDAHISELLLHLAPGISSDMVSISTSKCAWLVNLRVIRWRKAFAGAFIVYVCIER